MVALVPAVSLALIAATAVAVAECMCVAIASAYVANSQSFLEYLPRDDAVRFKTAGKRLPCLRKHSGNWAISFLDQPHRLAEYGHVHFLVIQSHLLQDGSVQIAVIVRILLRLVSHFIG